MNLLKLFQPSYLFDINPGNQFKFSLIFIIIFASIFIAGIIVKQYLRHKKDPALKKLFRYVPKRCYQFSIAGLFLVFMRQQDIPIVSMRFILLVLITAFFIYAGKIVKMYVKIYPAEVKKHSEKEKKKKYLP